MKVIAESVGEDTSYLTAGKEYEVVGDIDEDLCSIIDDEGDRIGIAFHQCAHISMLKWTKVEDTIPTDQPVP